ncbi:lipocalin family protein [Psychroflexus tropicus]|uniref:lipocalin family protein n=1 Tax=Psychroflexus tropicus TaxID=197345 RepID=UPI0003759D28|nr:lipocalin family protein [Psychroflexus tropicus]
MKKIKINCTLLLAIVLIIVSCSTDDDSNNSNITAEIYGKWKILESNYGGERETLDECSLLETLQFFENNELEIKEYEQTGNTTSCSEVGPDVFLDFSIENNVLTYTNPTGGFNGGIFTRKFNIIELTEQTLKLELYYERDGFEEDGNLPNNEIWLSTWTRLN